MINFKSYSLIEGSGKDDSISNFASGVTVNALAGNDTVNNMSPFVSIVAGTGNDFVSNHADYSTINGGLGNDSVCQCADFSSINGGYGRDLILVDGSRNTIRAYDGDDTISLGAASDRNLIEYAYFDDNDLIFGLSSSDSVKLVNAGPASVTLQNGTSSVLRIDDSVLNLRAASAFRLIATNLNDTVRNNRAGTTIDAGDGNNRIINAASDALILSGDGHDLITVSSGTHSTVNPGAGNDTLTLRVGSNLIEHADGLDLVVGARSTDTLHPVNAFHCMTSLVGSNVIADFGSSAVTLKSVKTVNLLGSDRAETIQNFCSHSVIHGGNGNDSIVNNASNVTLDGGNGNDFINVNVNEVDNSRVMLRYQGGDGADSIENFSLSDTLNIKSGSVGVHGSVGDDYVVRIDGGSLTFKDIGITPIRTIGSDGTVFAVNYDISNFRDRNSFGASAGNDSIVNTGSNLTVDAELGDDFVNNCGNRVLVDGDLGDDLIINSGGNYVTLRGGAGNDTLINEGGKPVTLEGGQGADLLIFRDSADNCTVNYSSGDGDDTVLGFDRNKMLRLVSGEIKSGRRVGDDYIAELDNGSIRFKNIGITPIQTRNAKNKLNAINYDVSNFAKRAVLKGSNGDERLFNAGNYASVNALGGNDLIYNWGSNAKLLGGDGNDTVINLENNSALDGGAGDDSLVNHGLRVSMVGGDGNDRIIDSGAATIRGGAGADTISLEGSGSRVEYSAGDGDDVIVGFRGLDTLRIVDGTLGEHGYVGSDYVMSVGNASTTGTITLKSVGAMPIKVRNSSGKTQVINYDLINLDRAKIVAGTATVDRIFNGAARATVFGLDDDDSIFNEGDSVALDGGDGADWIINGGSKVTIDGGSGNDSIDVKGSARSVIRYGGGRDVVFGLDGDDSIVLGAESWYTTMRSGADVIMSVDGGSITVKDISDEALNIVGGVYGCSIYNANNRKVLIGSNATDTIENIGSRVSIVGNDGDDVIRSRSSYVTINGGDGDDRITIDGARNVIEFDGLGRDVVTGFNGDDSLKLVDGRAYVMSIKGSDVMVTVGTGSVTLKGTGRDSVNIIGGVRVFGNYMVNEFDGVKVSGTDGGDYILNLGANVTIEGGSGQDTFEGSEHGEVYLFSSADGQNVIRNFGANDTIRTTAGTIRSVKTVGEDAAVSLRGVHYSGMVTLEGAGDCDFLWNAQRLVVDPINRIINESDGVSVKGTSGRDRIINRGRAATISAGRGSDTVTGSGLGDLYLFSSADGQNVITNFGLGDTLKATAGTIRSVKTVGEDAVVSLRGVSYSGTVTLEGAGDCDFLWNAQRLVVDPINRIINESDGVSVKGTSGRDRIINRGRAATISAGRGSDTVTGSGLGDLYLFSSADGQNVITNFGLGDTLRATAGTIRSVKTVGEDAVVSLRGANYSGTVTLLGAGEFDFDWNGQRLTVNEVALRAEMPSREYWFLDESDSLEPLDEIGVMLNDVNCMQSIGGSMSEASTDLSMSVFDPARIETPAVGARRRTSK